MSQGQVEKEQDHNAGKTSEQNYNWSSKLSKKKNIGPVANMKTKINEMIERFTKSDEVLIGSDNLAFV